MTLMKTSLLRHKLLKHSCKRVELEKTQTPNGLRVRFSLISWMVQARGATVVEYLVALILCVLVVLGISRLFGDTLYEKYRMGDERISEMERDNRNISGSRGAGSGNLVQATENDSSGSGKGAGKNLHVKTTLGSGNGLSNSGSQLEAQEDRKRRLARQHARAQGYDVNAPEKNQRQSTSKEDELVDPEMKKEHYALRGETPPEEFRFNPIILILIALLLLGLGYMMFKGNKEEG